MKLLLKLMYDGTGYCGFQSQKNGRSVQEVLTSAVAKLVGCPCTVTGCSRTDAGVHALGFCAAVAPVEEKGDRWLTIPPEKLPRAMGHFLPPDISVAGVALMGDDFHPRYDVASKEYIYKISHTPYADPFAVNRAWQLKKPVTEEGILRMQAAAERIRGYRDYSSFMAAGSKITDAHRTVYSCTLEQAGAGLLLLRICADGFLYNMVRIITGTLVDTGCGTFSPEEMDGVMEAKNRTAAGRTAPAHGLYLNRVNYPFPIPWVEIL